MIVTTGRDLRKGKEVASDLNASKKTSENYPEEFLSVLVGSNGIRLHCPATEEVNHKIHHRASERNRWCFDLVRFSEMADSR